MKVLRPMKESSQSAFAATKARSSGRPRTSWRTPGAAAAEVAVTLERPRTSRKRAAVASRKATAASMMGGGDQFGEQRLVGRVVDEVAHVEERDERKGLRVRARERQNDEWEHEQRRRDGRVGEPPAQPRRGAVGERADEEREEEREEALGADGKPDRARRRGRLSKEQRRVGRQHAHGERERERREREPPEEAWAVEEADFHASRLAERKAPANAASLPSAVRLSEPSSGRDTHPQWGPHRGGPRPIATA